MKKELRPCKSMPPICEYRITGKIVSIVCLELSSGNLEYYVRVDCGFLVDYPLSKSELMKFKIGEYKIGDYIQIDGVSRFDVNLPNKYNYKVITII
jgi:hypothetical protein